jgi:hypothetical protein
MKYIILFIIIYLIISTIKNHQKKIVDNNATNYGNIIDRMIVLYLLCEGDKQKFKKNKSKYYNEKIYTDDIFLFDFDYKFKISLFDKIILFYLFYFYSSQFWILKLDCKKHMYKFIDFVINNYINQNPPKNINENMSKTICIHFRCSDSPFNRWSLYELVSLNFYKEAIKIALSKQKFNKIIILLCSTHKGDTYNIFNKKISENKSLLNQQYCRNYINEYINNLENYNIPIEIKCNNINTDFYYLKNSGCSIITAGSFALYGAYASNNLLIISKNLKNNNYRKNIILINNYTINHDAIKDYYNMNEMKKHINKML